MSYQNVLYETDDRVAIVTLNRPEKLNALSAEHINDIIAAVQEAEADRNIRVVVIRGAGRAFSAGYDITPGRLGMDDFDMSDTISHFRQQNSQWLKVWNLTKPTIAQVHGYCLAGATDLTFSCDMIITAEDTVFGVPDVRTLASVGCHMWTYLVGPQWAKRIMLTGDPIDGKTAERIGLVMKSVPAEALEEEVMTLAKRIANISLEMLIPNKSLINKVMDLMGHNAAQQLSTDTAIITHHAEVTKRFHEMGEKEGFKAALLWRDGPFGDYSARPRKG